MFFFFLAFAFFLQLPGTTTIMSEEPILADSTDNPTGWFRDRLYQEVYFVTLLHFAEDHFFEQDTIDSLLDMSSQRLNIDDLVAFYRLDNLHDMGLPSHTRMDRILRLIDPEAMTPWQILTAGRNAGRMLEAAREAINRTRYNYARYLLRQVLRLQPDNETAAFLYAHALFQQNEPGFAERYLRENVQSFPDHGNIWFELGNIALEDNHPYAAHHAFGRSIFSSNALEALFYANELRKFLRPDVDARLHWFEDSNDARIKTSYRTLASCSYRWSDYGFSSLYFFHDQARYRFSPDNQPGWSEWFHDTNLTLDNEFYPAPYLTLSQSVRWVANRGAMWIESTGMNWSDSVLEVDYSFSTHYDQLPVELESLTMRRSINGALQADWERWTFRGMVEHSWTGGDEVWIASDFIEEWTELVEKDNQGWKREITASHQLFDDPVIRFGLKIGDLSWSYPSRWYFSPSYYHWYRLSTDFQQNFGDHYAAGFNAEIDLDRNGQWDSTVSLWARWQTEWLNVFLQIDRSRDDYSVVRSAQIILQIPLPLSPSFR